MWDINKCSLSNELSGTLDYLCYQMCLIQFYICLRKAVIVLVDFVMLVTESNIVRKVWSVIFTIHSVQNWWMATLNGCVLQCDRWYFKKSQRTCRCWKAKQRRQQQYLRHVPASVSSFACNLYRFQRQKSVHIGHSFSRVGYNTLFIFFFERHFNMCNVIVLPIFKLSLPPLHIDNSVVSCSLME